MMKLFDMSLGDAVFSPDQRHRYWLTREWRGETRSSVAWLMLNPSTATAEVNDPTIRRCIGFSKAWGFSRLIVVNLFAFRATDPRELARCADPVGPENDAYILKAARSMVPGLVMCAWGCQQHLTTDSLRRRTVEVARMIAPHAQLRCLGYRNDGAPRHPLMVPGNQPRMPFSIKEENKQ